MSRQQDIKKEFNIDLPIIFYDKSLRKMREYSVREQIDDLAGRNSILEEEKYKEQLLEIKKQIEGQIQVKKMWDHGWMRGKRRTLPLEIQTILELIKQAESNQSTYVKAYAEVKNKLDKYKEKSTMHSKDVNKVSEDLYKKMKL